MRTPMAMRVWEIRIALSLLIFGRLTCAVSARVSSSSAVCPIESVTDSFLGFPDTICLNWGATVNAAGVIEGDEISLQKALNMVHKCNYDYVALLFYASWCPFSKSCRPSFSILSSLYPSIPHFAIKESSIRRSILAKYGVHGFPTLFIFNSTMRVRYHGSRSLGSLVNFYSDITGINIAPHGHAALNNIVSSSNHEKHNDIEQESCPFSWARSPENMLRQETYLALATVFVLLRFLHIIFPALSECARHVWRRHIRNVSLGNFWERPQAHLSEGIQLFKTFKEPCKRSNLQEGAINARAWASKSLASVSIGEATSQSASICEPH